MAGDVTGQRYREPLRLGPGTRVAHYVIEEQVGAGGMAVVFRARDEVLGRLAAVKVLSSALAGDWEFRERFVRESRSIAAVDQPHVLPVYAAGESDGVLYIATRFVADGDLVRLLRRSGGTLSPDRAAALVGQVAGALDAAHAIGLVHRDVKPANVLVEAQSGRHEHAYLSDFGLSQSDSSVTGRLTAAGSFVGTPDYCAPEQITSQAVSGRADQYALGCVAFHLLTGTVPFPGGDPMGALYAHVHEPPPLASARVAGLPPAADAVLGRALDKRPAARYGSCGQFAEALREALEPPRRRGAPPGRVGVPSPATGQEPSWTGQEPPWTGVRLPVPPSPISSPPAAIPDAGRDAPVSGTTTETALAPGRRRALHPGAHAKPGRAVRRTRAKVIIAASAVAVTAAVVAGIALSSKPPGDGVTLVPPGGAEISVGGRIVVSPDGEYVAAEGTVSGQSRLYVWNTTTGQLVTTLDVHSGQPQSPLGFTGNDKDLVAFSGQKSTIYRIALSTGQRTALGTAPVTTNGNISGDLSTIAAENPAGTGISVTAMGGASIAPLLKNPATGLIPHSLQLDNSGDVLMVSSEKGTAYVVSTQTGALDTAVRFHATANMPLPILSPDGSTVLVPAGSNGAQLWTVGSPGSPSVNITPHDSRWPKDNGGFHYSTDGEVVLTFPNRGTTNDLWRELTGAHIVTRTDPGSQDQAFVLLGPGGRKLILGSNTRGGSAFSSFIVRDIPQG
jgi:serine/threonine protein kinase/WD40 repeat protein